MNAFFEAIDPHHEIDVYTDGACEGNPGPGGWGVFFIQGKHVAELSGKSEDITTNNRMEMLAAIKALEVLPKNISVILHTDSQYLKNGITIWIKGWKKNGWKTSAKEPVKNQDLWQILDALCSEKTPVWKWVRGHAGHFGNERADELASRAIKEEKRL